MLTAPPSRPRDPVWFVLAAGLLCGLPAAVPSNASPIPCPTSYVQIDPDGVTPAFPVDGVAYDSTFAPGEPDTRAR